MNYEQKYKEARERALQKRGSAAISKSDLEYIFPELKESEDERIRKEIINYFAKGKEYLSLCSFSKETILAWLERQAEQKPAWSEEDEKTLNEMFSVAARASLRKSTLFGKSYDYIKWQNWLKSIKDRYTWKPSKEQIIALRWVLNNVPYNKHKEEISGLLDQIKDL